VTVAANGQATTTAQVDLVERLGERTLLYARLADGTPITAEDEGLSRVHAGERVGLAINGAAAHIFDADERAYHAEARPE
jgi:multiple sugar transport system ATP-binding protein